MNGRQTKVPKNEPKSKQAGRYGNYMTKVSLFIFNYEYLDQETLNGFGKYMYKGLDTNPFNNQVAMPICDRLLYLIPKWLAPNILTLATFVIALMHYSILMYYDYGLYASSIELVNMQQIPNWVWLFSGIATITCVILDALDGKHARRINACSPVGEILDHSIDTWRMTIQAVTCFYSIFGRHTYGLKGYRLIWLLLSTQSLVCLIFWQQILTGILVYSWGMDIMQYMIAEFYLHTWYYEGADYWQGDGWCWGTNAEVTETWTHFIIFGVSFPMQFYHWFRHKSKNNSTKQSIWELIQPMLVPLVYFLTIFIWSRRNLYDSVIEEDPRAALWLAGVVFCDIMWRLLISNITQTTCPKWNRLLSFFISCIVYWYIRPRSMLQLDRITVQAAAILVTIVHLHLVMCTLNQMCRHFGINFFIVKSKDGH